MSQSEKWGQLGPDDPILALIREFYPSYPDGPMGEITSDPKTALLAIMVEQERGSDIVTSDESSEASATASYFAREYVVTPDGPRVRDSDGNLVEPDEVDGKKIDAQAIYSEWDVRGFDDDIMLAWKPPNRTLRDIKYRGGTDNPLAGVPAETRYVWLWRADSATSNPTVFLEGWSE